MSALLLPVDLLPDSRSDLVCDTLPSVILRVGQTIADSLQNPNEAKLYLSLLLGDLEREVFCCMFLDNRHRVMRLRSFFSARLMARPSTREK